MTLGRLIRLLEGERPDNTVRFDFGGFIPRRLGSWRGVYAELALGYDNDWQKPVTVAELLAELRSAIGKTFTGYKGGEFKMDKGTKVWADNYGEYNQRAIVGLADCDYRTVLATAFDD